MRSIEVEEDLNLMLGLPGDKRIRELEARIKELEAGDHGSC